MPAPQAVVDLVEHFRRNQKDYRSGKYNETQVRIEFVDPLFKALGWDVDNEGKRALQYQDVIHEAAIKIGGATKAPDYSFRIGGQRKFFVEAKKPSINIRDAPNPAFQVRRYAWSAKLPISILTDFEEFAVYDCRARPLKDDEATTARVMYVAYDEYVDRWDEIESLFSRQAVLGGDFDKFVGGFKKARGTQEVDAAFLAEIEQWREDLARNLALRNASLSQRELNFAVQRTIDRIIFLRIAEDRGIEPYNQLGDLITSEGIYANLLGLFSRADDKYNSGLFHFKDERGRPDSPDRLTPTLKIDDKVFTDILKNLYYPDSPYEFSVLPPDILGQVYEQFLGKVIRLTEGHRAKIEEKPEIKKAGGVYYTPTYIVDYIVENTVGKLVEGKTPRQVRKLRILDPACGSGSFLIGAYQYLLDWHLQQYLDSNSKAHKRLIYQGAGDEWRLKIAVRKEILLNNIYGVDIDSQAVEVTKLSLLLKVLEGENQSQLSLFQERVLPDLADNIKCGNSLIGSDFYAGTQMAMGLSPLSEEERQRINVFDWESEFKEIIKRVKPRLWLVTFVTHNSRVSERMVRFGVKKGEAVTFNDEEQLLIAEKIAEVCLKHEINVVSWNVMQDHVHMVISAEDESALNEKVRKIKDGSSRAFQRERGWGKGQHVWAQKFHRKAIEDEDALRNMIYYVDENHFKHGEGEEDSRKKGVGNKGQTSNKGLKPLVTTRGGELAKVLRDLRVPVQEALKPVAAGGFDAVIGNPPYIRIQTMKEWAPLEVEFYKKRYKAASKGNYDIYVVFVERGLSILNKKGLLGFIVPHKFFNAKYGEPLRGTIAKGEHLSEIVHFGAEQLFAGASTYTCLLFLTKSISEEFRFGNVKSLSKWVRTGVLKFGSINSSIPTLNEWNFVVGKPGELYTKLNMFPSKLGDSSHIFVGLQTSADTIFLFKDASISEDSSSSNVFSKVLEREIRVENELLKPVIRSGNIGRYFSESTALVLFPYENVENQFILITEKKMQKKFPLAWAYLLENKKLLENREKGKFKYSGWYQLYPKNLDLWEEPKLMIPYMTPRLACQFDSANHYFVNVTTGGFGLTATGIQANLKYIAGLINSKLLNFFFMLVSTNFRGGYFAANKQYLDQLPIRTIDFDNPSEVAQHDKMVSLVESMLSLNKQLAKARTQQDKTPLQRQIEATDKQLDALVYTLYDLTDEEIAIVEGGE